MDPINKSPIDASIFNTSTMDPVGYIMGIDMGVLISQRTGHERRQVRREDGRQACGQSFGIAWGGDFCF